MLTVLQNICSNFYHLSICAVLLIYHIFAVHKKMPFGKHVHFSVMAVCNVGRLLENGTNGQFIGLMLC